MSEADHTYTQDPALTDRDKVRFLVGDTDESNRLLTDAEVAWLISEEPNVYLAAASAARSLAAKFAVLVDKAVGDLRISYSKRNDHYAKLAASLNARGNVRVPVPYAGGTSIDDKRAQVLDTDRAKPAFSRAMHDTDPTAETKKPREDL